MFTAFCKHAGWRNKQVVSELPFKSETVTAVKEMPLYVVECYLAFITVAVLL